MSHSEWGEKDYYEILGVRPGATAKDIIAAYRGLARQYHPDVVGSDQNELAKFKQVSEAYEVLSDEESRRRYDRRRKSSRRGRSSSSAATQFGEPPQHANPAFTWVQRPQRQRAPLPTEFEIELPISPEEARGGGRCEFTMTFDAPCARCRGSAGGCDQCGGRGIYPQRRALAVTIPPGSRNGSTLRLELVGDGPAPAGRTLLVRLNIQPYW